MKIIGILILALELASLMVTLKSECKKQGITVPKIKDKFKRFVNKQKQTNSKRGFWQ